MGEELSVFDVSVTLTDGGVIVAGSGSPEGADVVAEVQITGGGSGSGNATVDSSGDWVTTVNVAARPGDSGLATCKATASGFPDQTAITYKQFTL